MKNFFHMMSWILYIICGLILCYWFIQVFFISFHKVTSSSMEPTLLRGDYIVVWKPILGARFYNIGKAMEGKRVNVYRGFGIRKIQRNDVVVFNYPYPKWNVWDKMRMDIKECYVKRCIGLPGDSLNIINGIYNTSNGEDYLGTSITNRIIPMTKGLLSKKQLSFTTMPFDSILKWNLKDFGPLYIPKKGDEIMLNRNNYVLYKHLIEWEMQDSLKFKDSCVYLNDNQQLFHYTFKHDYFFMAGDNYNYSVDSRYWGLIPDDFIIGKAWMIYKSVNPKGKKYRWERVFQLIK